MTIFEQMKRRLQDPNEVQKLVDSWDFKPAPGYQERVPKHVPFLDRHNVTPSEDAIAEAIAQIEGERAKQTGSLGSGKNQQRFYQKSDFDE